MLRIRLCMAASMLAALAATTPASASEGFDERSIEGTWVLSITGGVAEGLINGLFRKGTRLFAIARVIFDGVGGCESDDQIVVADQALPAISDDPQAPSDRRVALSCVYQVESDGYGSFTVEFANPTGGGSTLTTARFIIATDTQINLIANNDEFGIFGGGTLVRQSRTIR